MTTSVTAQIRELAVAIEAKNLRTVNYLGLSLQQKIMQRTPVDTGHARRSWLFEKATPGRLEARIHNNIEYIQSLENGWSQQAPSGMVAISVAELANETL